MESSRDPMRILLLNQAFHPDVVSTAQMAKDLADHLALRGHIVTAVASRSIYGQQGAVLPKREHIPVTAEPPGPTPPPAPTYPTPFIQVYRVGASIFGKAGIIARIADFAFFYLLALWRILTLPHQDVLVCFTTPPFISLVGLISKRLRRSKAVYWVMDLYPDLPVACGVLKPRALSTRFFEAFNRYLLRRSDATVVLGRCMRDRVLAKHVPYYGVHLIPVWSDLQPQPLGETAHPDSELRKLYSPDDAFTVMYSGNLGIGHDAQTMCRAMLRLKDRKDIRFVFVGGGKRRKEVQQFIDEHQLTSARWYDYQPREKLADSLAAADLHLISLKEGVEGIMVPSKLFGIMAVARPSIFIGHPSSEIARVLAEFDSGLTIREGDDAGLAQAIERFAADRARTARMGLNARHGLEGRYDRDTACQMWVDLLEALAAGRLSARRAPAHDTGPDPAEPAPEPSAS